MRVSIILSNRLRQSLVDRASAFRRRVQGIQAVNSEASHDFKSSLRSIEAYTRAIVRHTDEYWERFAEPFDRINEAWTRLADLKEKEELVDRTFSRMGHSELSRSFGRRVGSLIDSLELRPNLRTVITIGAPGNFETYLADLRGYLFHSLWLVDYTELEEYGHLRALITVPYLEGTRVYWEPLVVGHEVGHVVLHYLGNQDASWPTSNEYLSGILENIQLAPQDQRAQRWITEVLCDLFMLRIFGPASIVSLGEMLSVSEPYNTLGSSATHPPVRVRLRVLFAASELLGANLRDFEEILAPWRVLAEGGSELPQDDASVSGSFYEEQILEQNSLEHCWAEVCGWGDSKWGDYFPPSRETFDRVASLVKGFEAGIPGEFVSSTIQEESVSVPAIIRHADVVNAAWLTSHELAASRGQTSEEDDLADLQIDRLALRALDLLEFGDLWSRHSALAGSQRPSISPSYGKDGVDNSDSPYGMLGGADIVARLSESRADRRLVVTPLIRGSVCDAGLDLRLSSSFIVFKHSATAVFDAVLGDVDPQAMQLRVEKDWGEPFVLHPGELVLASTLEHFILPVDLAGTISTRSGYGRLGLETATASQVQPGSRGAITLELVNLGQTPIALRAGQRIAQMALLRLSSPAGPPTSTAYLDAMGPEFSKAAGDWDNRVLLRMRQELKGTLGKVGEDLSH
jgi:deoxycytidine triphosphate deaminase